MPTATMAPGMTENEPVISATMIITASGAWATLPKQAIIADDDENAWAVGNPGRTGQVGQPPDRGADERADHDARAEDAARAAGADRQRRRDDLGDRQDQHDPQRDRHQRVGADAICAQP